MANPSGLIPLHEQELRQRLEVLVDEGLGVKPHRFLQRRLRRLIGHRPAKLLLVRAQPSLDSGEWRLEPS